MGEGGLRGRERGGGEVDHGEVGGVVAAPVLHSCRGDISRGFITRIGANDAYNCPRQIFSEILDKYFNILLVS